MIILKVVLSTEFYQYYNSVILIRLYYHYLLWVIDTYDGLCSLMMDFRDFRWTIVKSFETYLISLEFYRLNFLCYFYGFSTFFTNLQLILSFLKELLKSSHRFFEPPALQIKPFDPQHTTKRHISIEIYTASWNWPQIAGAGGLSGPLSRIVAGHCCLAGRAPLAISVLSKGPVLIDPFF